MVMSLVVPNLYIGSLEDANDTPSMINANVNRVISIGCPTPAKILSVEHLSYEEILDKPEQPILHVLKETNGFIKKCLTAGNVVFVHCVYGQSRSAVLIISYLISTGLSICEALCLLKKQRPVICVNPGFLAQLYLLAKKGFDSADVQLIIQSQKKFHSAKSSKQDTDDDSESPSKLRKLNYADSYRNVRVGVGLGLSGEGRKEGGMPLSREEGAIPVGGANNMHIPSPRLGTNTPEQQEEGQRQTPLGATDAIGIEIEDVNEGNTKESVNETLVCLECKYFLAREENIVRATAYSDFLVENTDEYWVGYKAIHPYCAYVTSLDNCAVDKPSKKKQEKNTHSNAKKGDKGAVKCGARNGAEGGSGSDEVCVGSVRLIGLIDWIAVQVHGSGQSNKGVGAETGTGPKSGAGGGPGIGGGRGEERGGAGLSPLEGSRMTGQGVTALHCPSCTAVCGYHRKNSLEICNTFLRCDLVALYTAKIKCLTS